MDRVALEISYSNDVTYKNIVLRKFFNMIFVDASGRKLYIYTATVFGGTLKDFEEPEKAYISISKSNSVPCSLNFKYKCDPEGVITKVNCIDLTHSFCQQTDCISKVWGECKSLYNQSEIMSTIREIYPDSPFDFDIEKDIDATQHLVYINQGDKQSHKCIVRQGIFEYNEGDYGYKLTEVNKQNLDKVETVNWVKTEIELNSTILNRQVSFSIVFNNQKIFTPDFTWYFAPPAGYIISTDSYVKIGNNKSEKNAIQSVSDETTVPFSEWTSPPESIDERKKSRVLFKSAPVKNQYRLSDDKEISVFIQIINPQGPSNRQFFAGLLIAFLLTFCSDKTRIDYFLYCSCKILTQEMPYLSASLGNLISIIMPVLLLLAFISCVLSPSKVFPPRPGNKTKNIKRFRILGLVSIIALVVYIYCGWLIFPCFLNNYIGDYLNLMILFILGVLGLAGNATYICYCIFKLKRKISNYM